VAPEVVDFVVDKHVHTLGEDHVSENRLKTEGDDGRHQSSQSTAMEDEDVAVTTGQQERRRGG
jgi:hypothetical protein